MADALIMVRATYNSIHHGYTGLGPSSQITLCILHGQQTLSMSMGNFSPNSNLLPLDQNHMENIKK